MIAGQLVVKVIDVQGSKSATIKRVESVRGGVVRLVGSGLSWLERTGEEIAPMIPGCESYLVQFDAGEVELWDLMAQADEALL